MRSARKAALRAPHVPTPSVPTGTPGGICTVASSASNPPSGELASGTPEHRAAGECAAIAPGQVRRAAGARDDHLEAARARALRPRRRRVRRAMRRAHRDLARHAELGEHVRRLFHDRAVRLAAHHDPDPCARFTAMSFILSAPMPALPQSARGSHRVPGRDVAAASPAAAPTADSIARYARVARLLDVAPRAPRRTPRARRAITHASPSRRVAACTTCTPSPSIASSADDRAARPRRARGTLRSTSATATAAPGRRVHGGRVERARGRALEQREQRAADERQHHLRLRIAEAHVEFHHRGAVRAQHQPAVQQRRGTACRARAMRAEQRRHDAHPTPRARSRHPPPPAGANAPMPPVFGPLVAIERALEIARRRQQHVAGRRRTPPSPTLPRPPGTPRSPPRARCRRSGRPPGTRRGTAAASASIGVTHTPLPAARPSALITHGGAKRPSAASASAQPTRSARRARSGRRPRP